MRTQQQGAIVCVSSIVGAVATVPMGRAGEASEISEVIAFLLSDKASYIAGQTIVVDGGLTVSL